MNYRHAYHAGNFADVMKHTALVAVLLHLRKKDAPFVVVDTHAGRGLYDLAGEAAAKTGEADAGIARLLAESDIPGVLRTYADIVRGFGAAKYPGSPVIAAQLLRKTDRLVAIEKHVEEFAALKAALAASARARAVLGDGYEQLKRLVPPPERRGMILIDPPYEQSDEFEHLAACFADAFRRFATGIYLIWLPIKTRHDADALAGEILNEGVVKLLLLTLDVGHASDAPPERLAATGLFVVNPPFGFADEMQDALAFMARQLVQNVGGVSNVEWLTGGE